jgi:cyclophilin family peptidyl-prolyl cis-trans isomerase
MKRFYLLVLAGLLSCGKGRETQVVLQTPRGDIVVRLFRDTPRHRDAFLHFVAGANKDTVLFNRVWRDHLIAFGPLHSPATEGEILKPEGSFPLRNGALVSVDGPKPDYFIVQGNPVLKGNYTVFGLVAEGMQVVDRIAAVPRDAADRPLEDVWVSFRIFP